MKKITTTLLTLATSAVVLTNCTKKGDPGPAGAAGAAGATGATGATGPAGQTLSGNLVGFVNPIDEFSATVNSKSGFTVTLEGITPMRTATSDANGRFEFTSVPTGTYVLLYQKAGFGDYRRYGVTHIGGNQPTNLGSPLLVQSSNTRPIRASYYGPGSSGPLFSLGLANPLANSTNTSSLRYVMFFSTLPTVTSANAEFSTTSSVSLGTAANFLTTVSRTFFTSSNGVAPGTTLYAAVYGAPSTLSSYVDFTTGKTVYLGLNPTPAATFSFVLQ